MFSTSIGVVVQNQRFNAVLVFHWIFSFLYVFGHKWLAQIFHLTNISCSKHFNCDLLNGDLSKWHAVKPMATLKTYGHAWFRLAWFATRICTVPPLYSLKLPPFWNWLPKLSIFFYFFPPWYLCDPMLGKH